MNSAKRKQKDTKNREIFEKTFPEIKKIREDQGQKDGGKGDDGHGAFNISFCSAYINALKWNFI